MIDRAPEQEKAELEKAYSRLSESLDLFQKTTQSVKQAIDLNLHAIHKALEKVDAKQTRSFTSRKA